MARRVAAALLLVGLLVTSGCLGFLTGQSALTFEANEVSVSEQARSEANYQETRTTESEVTRTFTAAGETRNVTVTNHVAEYQRSASVGPLSEQPIARFTVIASPEVEVAERTFNPLADLSNRELAEQLQQKYETVENVRFEANRSVTVLGEEATVSRFSADATIEGGQQLDVFVHITKVKHGSDFVVAVAVHPEDLQGEQSRVDTLLSGIEHETDG